MRQNNSGQAVSENEEPLLPVTAKAKKVWWTSGRASAAVSLITLDTALVIILYLLSTDFKPVQAFKDDLASYNPVTSAADLLVLALARILFSSVALQFRQGMMGVGTGVLLTALLVAKAGAFKLWAFPEHQFVDILLLASLLFSVVTPGVLVPLAIVSLNHAEELETQGLDNKEQEKKTLSTGQLLKLLRPYFWPRGLANRVKACSTWFILLVSKGANIAAPLALAAATNAIGDRDLYRACMMTGVYCGLRLSASVFKEFQSMAYLTVKQAAYIEIASHTFKHLHTLSLDWHLRKKMGNTLRAMDRGIDSTNTVVNMLFLYLLPTIGECFTVILVFFFHYGSSSLAALVFVCLFLYAWLTIKLTLWRKKFREFTNKHDNEFHDRATDSLINFETVKYFNAEAYEVERYSSAVGSFQKYSTSTQLSLSLLNISQQLLQQGTMCLALVIMVYESPNVGAYVAVQAYLMQLFTPLNFLGTIYGSIINGLVDVKNLSELLAENPDITDIPGAKDLVCSPSNPPELEYRNIIFHYPTQDPQQGLKNVSFVAPAGCTTAVVGHTGSGKTTLGRLLFRFYDPLSGMVMLGGRDISKLTQASVRQAIGVVPQDTVLFNESLLHNVLYGRLGASLAECEQAAEQAQILNFIRSLPEMWDTKVGERGLKLSGGEKQRVAIARCLLKNPPVVLLDEATSALDSRTERDVQQSLTSLGQNRTTLVIAHRLSTIRQAEQIIVMETGNIIERGNHDSLLEAEGMYAMLWNNQINEQPITPSASATSLNE